MSLKTTEFVTNNNMVIVPHPPYLPDLAMTARVQLQKISGCEPQVVWHQDELIGGKPPFINLTSTVSYKYGVLAFQVGGVSNLKQ
jgi:hypothetical protein